MGIQEYMDILSGTDSKIIIGKILKCEFISRNYVALHIIFKCACNVKTV